MNLLRPVAPRARPQRAHARFGARADQAHHLHRRHVFQNLFGQFDFALGGGAKRKAVKRGFLHRFEHGRVAVAQDHRAPGADVVDVFLAVGVPEISALGALHKAGCAAHGAEGAHRRVDPTGDHLGGAVKKGLVAVGHGACLWLQCLVSLNGTSK